MTREEALDDKELKRLIWEEWKEEDPRQMAYKYMVKMREILSEERKILKDIEDIVDNVPELNMGNYCVEDVELLNNAIIDISLMFPVTPIKEKKG